MEVINGTLEPARCFDCGGIQRNRSGHREALARTHHPYGDSQQLTGQTRCGYARAFSFWGCEALQANLSTPKDVQRIVAFAENHGRHIKYLVNAAGYFKPTPFLEHRPTDYDLYLDLNRAFFFISQAVAKNMAAHGGGSIVHIGSMWAQQAIKAMPSSAYSMAKAGLHALTQHMAMELAGHNIRVNAVSPAVVKTPIYELEF